MSCILPTYASGRLWPNDINSLSTNANKYLPVFIYQEQYKSLSRKSLISLIKKKKKNPILKLLLNYSIENSTQSTLRITQVNQTVGVSSTYFGLFLLSPVVTSAASVSYPVARITATTSGVWASTQVYDTSLTLYSDAKSAIRCFTRLPDSEPRQHLKVSILCCRACLS